MEKKSLIIILFLLFFFFPLKIKTSTPAPPKDKISLQEPLSLSLRYKAGETLYYRLNRHTVNFKMDGSKSSGDMKAVGYFQRIRIENDDLGRVREKLIWKSFALGQSWSPGQSVKMSYFKEAEDFSLIFSVNDEDALRKLDFSSLPPTMEGMWLMIMTWDAVTFDGLTRPNKFYEFPESAQIGAEFRDTRGSYDFPFDFPPLLTDSKYSFSGKNYARILGVSLVRNIPCAIIEFSNLENRVFMNLHLKPVELKSSGFEHFWGKTYLSLEDGRIVKGEVIGPVLMISDVQMPGQKEPSHGEFLALQSLELDLLTSEEFNQEIQKLKEIK